MENERYLLVKIFDNEIWVPKSPVEVLQGALINDNLIGQRCLQLSLLSATGKRISSTYVDVFCFDADGESISDEPISLIFKEIVVSRGAVFGEDETNYLRSGKVESVKCAVTRVVFGDGSVWHAQDEPVEITALSFDEIDGQLKAIFNELLKNSLYANTISKYKYIPRQENDFWICACGRANESENSSCQRCGMNRTWIMQNLSVSHLRRILDERVERARREAEEERMRAVTAQKALQQQAEAEARIGAEPDTLEEKAEQLEKIEKPERAAPRFAARPMRTEKSERPERPVPAILPDEITGELEEDGGDEDERPPIVRYIILGVLGVALAGIGYLIYLLSTNKIPI